MFMKMDVAFNSIIIVAIIIAVLAVVAGIIFLQIFLSKRNSKWLGLILPIISFLLSLIYPLNIVNTGDTWQNIGVFISLLLLANILTIVMLVIHIAIRKNRKKKAQLEKMNIQDLN